MFLGRPITCFYILSSRITLKILTGRPITCEYLLRLTITLKIFYRSTDHNIFRTTLYFMALLLTDNLLTLNQPAHTYLWISSDKFGYFFLGVCVFNNPNKHAHIIVAILYLKQTSDLIKCQNVYIMIFHNIASRYRTDI